MAINLQCDKCREELSDFGGILLGPPNENDEVKKYHLCKNCFKELSKDL